MKKTLIIISAFLLTGCFGEVGKGYITKECTKIENINNMNINKKITIKSNQGKITDLNIIEKYQTENDITVILNSKKSEQNMYKKESGISINIEDNIITYNIDIKNASNLVKERFNIEEETHKMIKYYEENGYKCK